MTVKTVTFMKSANSSTAKDFQQWFLSDHGPKFSRRHPELKKVVVNLVDVDPKLLPWRRPGEGQPVAEQAPYDVICETWMEDEAEPPFQIVEGEVASWCREWHAYTVSERIEKDEQPVVSEGRSPGVKYVALCWFFDDLSTIGAQRSWANHVGLALKVHVGMSKYVRNWVERISPHSASDAGGIVEMHFPTIEAMQQRWFDSDRGREEIVQDVGHFLKKATRMLTSEYVLRSMDLRS